VSALVTQRARGKGAELSLYKIALLLSLCLVFALPASCQVFTYAFSGTFISGSSGTFQGTFVIDMSAQQISNTCNQPNGGTYIADFNGPATSVTLTVTAGANSKTYLINRGDLTTTSDLTSILGVECPPYVSGLGGDSFSVDADWFHLFLSGPRGLLSQNFAGVLPPLNQWQSAAADLSAESPTGSAYGNVSCLTEIKGQNLQVPVGGCSPISITPSSLPNGIWQTSPPEVVQSGYGPANLLASGGSPRYTWSTTGLPDGLSLDATTGTISGTFAEDAENSCTVGRCTFDPAKRQFQITVSLTDSSGNSAGPTTLTMAWTCGGDGSRDGLIQQYTNVSAEFPGASQITDSVTSKRFVPRCMDVTQSAHSLNYSFPSLNSSNTTAPTVALLADSLLYGNSVFALPPPLYHGPGLNGWVGNFGKVPVLNGIGNQGSGFRPPLDQVRVYLKLGLSPKPGSRHMFGDAVDLQVLPTGDFYTWKAMCRAAINAGVDWTECGNSGPIQELSCSRSKMYCVHADWRKATSLAGGTTPYAQ
jgi:hypothetical protein